MQLEMQITMQSYTWLTASSSKTIISPSKKQYASK